jgi:hypothetical protein
MARRQILVALIVGVLGVLVGFGVVRGRKQSVIAQTISRGLAKHACSCMFISKRSLQACLNDLPGADQLHKLMVRFEVDSTEPGKSVATTVYGVFRGEAVYETGAGCTQY